MMFSFFVRPLLRALPRPVPCPEVHGQPESLPKLSSKSPAAARHARRSTQGLAEQSALWEMLRGRPDTAATTDPAVEPHTAEVRLASLEEAVNGLTRELAAGRLAAEALLQEFRAERAEARSRHVDLREQHAAAAEMIEDSVSAQAVVLREVTGGIAGVRDHVGVLQSEVGHVLDELSHGFHGLHTHFDEVCESSVEASESTYDEDGEER